MVRVEVGAVGAQGGNGEADSGLRRDDAVDLIPHLIGVSKVFQERDRLDLGYRTAAEGEGADVGQHIDPRPLAEVDVDERRLTPRSCPQIQAQILLPSRA